MRAASLGRRAGYAARARPSRPRGRRCWRAATRCPAPRSTRRGSPALEARIVVRDQVQHGVPADARKRRQERADRGRRQSDPDDDQRSRAPSVRHPSRRDCWLGADPAAEGTMGMPIAVLSRCRSRHAEMGGRSQPRPRSADRHRRSAGRGATARAPATWTTDAVSVRPAISCPATREVSRTRTARQRRPRAALNTDPPKAGGNAIP